MFLHLSVVGFSFSFQFFIFHFCFEMSLLYYLIKLPEFNHMRAQASWVLLLWSTSAPPQISAFGAHYAATFFFFNNLIEFYAASSMFGWELYWWVCGVFNRTLENRTNLSDWRKTHCLRGFHDSVAQCIYFQWFASRAASSRRGGLEAAVREVAWGFLMFYGFKWF